MLGIIIASAIVVLVVAFLVKSHALKEVSVKEESFPTVRIAYLTFIGAYKDAYKENAKIEEFLKTTNSGKDFTKEPCIGIYYDNPQNTPAEKCRSVIGKILPEGTVEAKNDQNIKYADVEIGNTAVVHFPLDNIMSLYVGMMKSYPILNRWCSAHKDKAIGAASVELYGYIPQTVSFIAPLGKREGILAHFP